jgi:16S rRNA processing protein RimM
MMGGDQSALMELGVLGAPQGLRGWLRCRSFTEPPERIFEHARWRIGLRGEWRDYEVASSANRNGRMAVKLQGIDSPEAAAQLRGAIVAVPRSALPPLASNEYFRVDLIGFEVMDLAEHPLGTLTHFVDTPAHAVMVVGGEIERMIPAVPRYVRRVDLAGRRVYVDWQDSGD